MARLQRSLVNHLGREVIFAFLLVVVGLVVARVVRDNAVAGGSFRFPVRFLIRRAIGDRRARRQCLQK
jgi:hypothetical protein